MKGLVLNNTPAVLIKHISWCEDNSPQQSKLHHVLVLPQHTTIPVMALGNTPPAVKYTCPGGITTHHYSSIVLGQPTTNRTNKTCLAVRTAHRYSSNGSEQPTTNSSNNECLGGRTSHHYSSNGHSLPTTSSSNKNMPW